MRIILAAFLLAAGSVAAAAQSGSTPGTVKPMLSAPTSGQSPSAGLNAGQKKIPPAARSGEKGLRVGEGAVTGEPVEIWRKK